MVKKAERWNKKQIDRAAVAEDEYKAGIADPDRNPIDAALAAAEKRTARVKESLEKKTWEAAMKKLTIEDWRKPALAKGPARFIEGVKFAEPKIRDFVAKWRPILEEIQAAVRAMPEVTDADREKRMIENLRRLKKAKGTWK